LLYQGELVRLPNSKLSNLSCQGIKSIFCTLLQKTWLWRYVSQSDMQAPFLHKLFTTRALDKLVNVKLWDMV